MGVRLPPVVTPIETPSNSHSWHPSSSFEPSPSISPLLSLPISRHPSCAFHGSVPISLFIPFARPCTRTCWVSTIRQDRTVQKHTSSCFVVVDIRTLVVRYPSPPPENVSGRNRGERGRCAIPKRTVEHQVHPPYAMVPVVKASNLPCLPSQRFRKKPLTMLQEGHSPNP